MSESKGAVGGKAAKEMLDRRRAGDIGKGADEIVVLALTIPQSGFRRYAGSAWLTKPR
jgi:hypothetical protein